MGRGPQLPKTQNVPEFRAVLTATHFAQVQVGMVSRWPRECFEVPYSMTETDVRVTRVNEAWLANTGYWATGLRAAYLTKQSCPQLTLFVSSVERCTNTLTWQLCHLAKVFESVSGLGRFNFGWCGLPRTCSSAFKGVVVLAAVSSHEESSQQAWKDGQGSQQAWEDNQRCNNHNSKRAIRLAHEAVREEIWHKILSLNSKSPFTRQSNSSLSPQPFKIQSC